MNKVYLITGVVTLDDPTLIKSPSSSKGHDDGIDASAAVNTGMMASGAPPMCPPLSLTDEHSCKKSSLSSTSVWPGRKIVALYYAKIGANGRRLGREEVTTVLGVQMSSSTPVATSSNEETSSPESYFLEEVEWEREECEIGEDDDTTTGGACAWFIRTVRWRSARLCSQMATFPSRAM